MSALTRALGRSGRNLVLSSASEVGVRLLGFVYLMALSRHLQPEGFGTFNVLQSYLVLTVALGAFGLDRLAYRDLALEGAGGARFGTLLRLRVGASALSALLLVGIGGWLQPHLSSLLALVAAAAIAAAVAGSFTAAFHAEEDFGPPAAAAAASALTLLAWSVAGVLLDRDLAFFVWGLVGSEAARAAWLAGARGGPRGEIFGFDRGLARRALKSALPFAALSLLGVIYFRIDMIMLDLLAPGREVGLYAGSYRILEALALLPALLLGVLFPRLARLQRDGGAEAGRLYLLATRALVWSGLAIAVAATLGSAPLLRLLFGPEYAGGAASLSWLMIALVFLFWHAPNVTVLLGSERLRTVVQLSVLTTAFNIGLNLVAIPRYGAAGAAAATAASEALSLLLFTPVVCRRLGIGPSGYARALGLPRVSRDELRLLLNRDPAPAPHGS